jgi:hypothetical protein
MNLASDRDKFRTAVRTVMEHCHKIHNELRNYKLFKNDSDLYI